MTQQRISLGQDSTKEKLKLKMVSLLSQDISLQAVQSFQDLERDLTTEIWGDRWIFQDQVNTKGSKPIIKLRNTTEWLSSEKKED